LDTIFVETHDFKNSDNSVKVEPVTASVGTPVYGWKYFVNYTT